MNSALEEGYRSARAVTQQHAKSFFLASFALFGPRRRAAFALYAFCRRLDDLVDLPGEVELSARLDRARELVTSLYRPARLNARAELSAEWPWHAAEIVALEDTLHRFHIPEAPLQDLISGMEMDVVPRAYASYRDLDLYCYRVAGTVGLMLTPILGFTSVAALEPAADLGRAMQLTNILRDIREDLDRGRCYLPQDELAAFGVTEGDLKARRVNEAFVALMKFQIARARVLYREAASGVAWLTGFGSKRMVRMMGSLYEGILGDIEARGFDVFSARAHVPPRRKLAIAARAFFGPAPSPSARVLSPGSAP